MKYTPVYLSEPGLVCAAGNSIKTLWMSAIEGSQKGIRRVKTSSGKCFYAGKIEDTALKPTKARYDMRIVRIEDAALSPLGHLIAEVRDTYGRDRVAVCVGSCDNGSEFSEAAHRYYFANGTFPHSYSLEVQGAAYAATYISEKYKLSGPSLALATACSSGATAIARAADLIRSGLADAAVAGGADVASDTVLFGFDSLGAVSRGITNPFSKNRDGITLGEGAAFFLLTRDPVDDSRIALLGTGESSDAYHITSPDPSGAGAVKAMASALSSAGLKAGDIGYINLHGTGTRANDSMEAKAVYKVFRDSGVMVSSTKPLTGHTLGAAGALEAAFCYAAIAENKNTQKKHLPVQIWDHEADEGLPQLNFLCDGEGKNGADICMSNTFAFGGCNVSLVIGCVA